VVDFLVLVEAFIQIRFAGSVAPDDVPLVALSVDEIVSLKK
jgi:hypothetical protein